MSYLREVQEFGDRWLKKFQNEYVDYKEILNVKLQDEFFKLEFMINAGIEFSDIYKDEFEDFRELDKIIHNIDDIELLGSAIHFKWADFLSKDTYIEREKIFEKDNREWFIIAFTRIITLAKENMYVFIETPKEIKIMTNGSFYNNKFKKINTIKQEVKIDLEGKVNFSNYIFNLGLTRYEKNEQKEYRIRKIIAVKILNIISRYFSEEKYIDGENNIGIWKMEIKDSKNKIYKLNGNLNDNFEILGTSLSDIIRDVLKIDNLNLFDGKIKKINKVSIEYKENKNFKNKERIIIDRESESIICNQKIKQNSEVLHKYKIKDEVKILLDKLYTDYLISSINETSLKGSKKKKIYKIKIHFEDGEKRIIKIPKNEKESSFIFKTFRESISSFISFYDFKHFFKKAKHRKRYPRKDEYIFCSVTFCRGGKTYYYLAKDTTINLEDYVMVPVGKENIVTRAKVSEIEYFTKDKAPFSVDNIKKIIRKCTDEDFKR